METEGYCLNQISIDFTTYMFVSFAIIGQNKSSMEPFPLILCKENSQIPHTLISFRIQSIVAHEFIIKSAEVLCKVHLFN